MRYEEAMKHVHDDAQSIHTGLQVLKAGVRINDHNSLGVFKNNYKDIIINFEAALHAFPIRYFLSENE